MSSTETNSDRPDYTPQIKREVEETVKNLLLRYSGYGEFSNEPEYLELGYLVAHHAGKEIFKTGDLVLGLPVRISRSNTRSLALYPEVFLGNYEREYFYDEYGIEYEKYLERKQKLELISETW
jgi:hypothetical protein